MTGGWAVAVLLALALGSGAGSVLRAAVLARVGGSGSARARALGSAWVNVPACVLAAAALVRQAEPGLLGASPAPALLLAGVLGLCGGLSTWSTLSLELARSLLAGDRSALRLQLGGIGLGLLGGVFGAGLGGLTLLVG